MEAQQFEVEVLKLANGIEQLDYYQVLSVERMASLGMLRKAYHAMSRRYHPDRFFHLADGPLKDGIARIAKRVAEAYITLRDPQKRRFYDQQLAQTQGAGVRYTEQSAQAQKQAKVEETGKTEKGRQAYRQGMQELQKKNFVAAERAFKMALAYEPENALFQKSREDAAKNIKTDYTIR
jgi:DnaJ-class molecular chaperone